VAKRRFSISVPLPAYARPRNEWRRRVHGAVLDVQTRRGVGYRESDQLEVRISLPLGDRALDIHEIDEPARAAAAASRRSSRRRIRSAASCWRRSRGEPGGARWESLRSPGSTRAAGPPAS